MATNLVASSFTAAALDGLTVELRRVQVEESLDHPFVARVWVEVAPGGDVDTSSLVNDDGVLVIERPGLPPRRLVGIVDQASQTQNRAEEGTIVALRLVPALSMLSYTRNTRIFQDKTAPEIIEEVLGEALGAYGREVQNGLSEEYPAREYCVQYQESDLRFVQRLMEEEGITYTFDHEGDPEVMSLYDRNQDMPELGTVSFVPVWADIVDEEGIAQVGDRHRTTVTSVAVLDYDFTGPTGHTGQESGADDLGRDRESYEHGWGQALTIGDYDEGVTRYQENDGDRQALVRQQAYAATGRTIAGVSRVTGFAAGARFSLSGHALDGDYLVIRVSHENCVPSGVAGSFDDRYHNRFEAIPVDVPYRPERCTPKPHIHSVLSALITGPAGEEIHTDEHGRVKVQFHWDRVGENDESSTCWLRVSQPWAGSSWGFVYLPRIGMEATVAFVHGDPDRPVVISTMYNASNLPPYELPSDRSKSTIKSESSLGAGGFNEFRFEDKKGEEEVFIHAQKDFDEVVLANHTTTVGHDQENTVDNDQTQLIHTDQKEEVTQNQTMTVHANRTVCVYDGFDETIDGGEERVVLSGSSETIIGDEERKISGGVDESILGGEIRLLIGAQTEIVTSKLDQTVIGASARTITGTLDTTAIGGVTWTASATFNLMAVAGFTLTGTGGIILMAPTINITTASEKEMDGSTVTKLIGSKKTEVGLSIAYDAITLQTQGTAYANVGLAVDIGTARAEAVGASVSMSNVKLGVSGTSAGCGVLNIQRKSVRLIN